MIETTPKELNNMLVDQIESVVSYLLPDGVKKRNEWVVGSLAGEAGKSLCVRLHGDRVGVWSDFATGDTGGDLLDLWGAVNRMSFVEVLSEVKKYLGVKDDKPNFTNRKKYIKPVKPEINSPSNKMVKWFSDRMITEETIKKLKIAENNDAIVFPYISPEGELELLKYRSMSEKKFWSNKDPIPCLFGWQAVSDSDRDIVIVEGEIDCLSFWEKNIPSLSIPKGAGSGEKQSWIEYEYERLKRFDNIYICMDNDEAGFKAKTEIISRLGRERCLIVELHVYKDANDVLLAGDDLKSFILSAKTEDPKELCKLSDFHNDILSDLQYGTVETPGMFLPWEKSRKEIKLRPSETTIWAGINSHGKSSLLSHVIVDGISQGEKFCVASMEMPAISFGNELYKQVGWKMDPDSILKQSLFNFIDRGLWIFNSYGTAKASKIMDVFNYARKRYGVNHFIIDSLAKCGFAEDDYNNQKSFVDSLVDFALENNVHVHLVSHVRKKGSENDMPGKFDIKGTGAIIDMVSNAFIVWRNKPKEMKKKEGEFVDKKEPDAILSCVKQRKTGVEPMYKLWFDGNSRQFLPHEEEFPKTYIF